MDEESGKIEAVGKFFAGEQFSLTVQVADELQRQAQAILEVQVVPGANSAGPQFVIDGNERDNSRGYSLEVNEAAPVHSVVLQLRAVDPENDQISYSLVAPAGDGSPANQRQSGQPDFSLNSRTGILSVANKLDREEISAYNLLVQARDSGGRVTTRPIQITITDCNDNNPQFGQPSYVFSLAEGSTQAQGRPIGRVQASDSDAGENGRVTYSLIEPGHELEAKLFGIDERTGEIWLLANETTQLDYETKAVHTLMVSARDNGETPRSSSASVLVRLLDVQDELPHFERAHLLAELEENLAPGQRVGQVQARDLDSEPQVSYLLLAGPANLFAVDPQTGVVSTKQALDCEAAKLHTLLIGTNESLASDQFQLVEASNRLNAAIRQQTVDLLAKSPIVRLDVRVGDLNDNAPQFEWPEQSSLLPVRLQDTAQLGTRVVQLRASDRDSSVPNNQVRFELVRESWAPNDYSQQQAGTSERCAKLFVVDPSSGLVSVGSDLRRELQLSECQLVVRVHDLPTDERRQLASVATLTVFLDHLADSSPSTMVGFGDSQFTVELRENAPANTLVKVLPVVNKPKLSSAALPLSCELIEGNEMGKFYVRANDQFDCELRTRDSSLDMEVRQRYTLMVKLNTIGSSGSLFARVQVNLLDENDNRPSFAVPSRYAHLTSGRFLAAIAHDSPSETQVIHLRATDQDASRPNNLISYELQQQQQQAGAPNALQQSGLLSVSGEQLGLDEASAASSRAPDLIGSKFRIEPADGVVRTVQSLEDVPASRLPLRLRVLARDNPAEPDSSLESGAEVVLNLIDERHRIGLALRDTPSGRVLERRDQLLAILQERTGLIAGLERVESLKVRRNSSLVETDVAGSDVWLYLIEPGTLRIVASDDSRVRASLFESRAQSSLADVLEQTLGELKHFCFVFFGKLFVFY